MERWMGNVQNTNYFKHSVYHIQNEGSQTLPGRPSVECKNLRLLPFKNMD